MNSKSIMKIATLVVASLFLQACSSMQWSATRIDQESDDALKVFNEQIDGAQVFLDQASGYLVFPRALRAGLVAGAETGEGVLRIDGKTVDYMRITSGSIGLQAGAQSSRTQAETAPPRSSVAPAAMTNRFTGFNNGLP